MMIGELPKSAHLLFSVLFVLLFVSELATFLLSHCAVVRLCMCHTLLISLLNCGVLAVWHYKLSRRSLCLWLVVCSVAGLGFWFTNAIHGVRMLIHRHDDGIHHTQLIVGVAAVDVVLKFGNYLLNFDAEYSMNRLWSSVFHVATGLGTLFVSASAYSAGGGNNNLSQRHSHVEPLHFVLYLDPALTVLISAALACLLVEPLKKNVPVLMLAVPPHLDVERMRNSLKDKLPHVESHDLRVWQESAGDYSVSVHLRRRSADEKLDGEVRQKAILELQQTAIQSARFLRRQGASRVFVQPDFD